MRIKIIFSEVVSSKHLWNGEWLCVHALYLYRHKCGKCRLLKRSVFSGRKQYKWAIVIATFVHVCLCDHKYDFTIATWKFWLHEKQRLGTEPGMFERCVNIVEHNESHRTPQQQQQKAKNQMKLKNWDTIECVGYLFCSFNLNEFRVIYDMTMVNYKWTDLERKNEKKSQRLTKCIDNHVITWAECHVRVLLSTLLLMLPCDGAQNRMFKQVYDKQWTS